jgi:hypothetical protein
MQYCESCGSEIDENSRYCKKCRKKVSSLKDTYQQIFQPKPELSIKEEVEESNLKEAYDQIFQDTPRPPETRRLAHIGREAPLLERCIAYWIDEAIISFIPCFGCIYAWFKDGVNEGRSVGKYFMGLRVVDYQSGVPASYEQSFVRNCCPGCLDGCCCYIPALINEEGRRIGDRVAGTIVILDQ